ncbi:MAG: PAS domain S-box protein [Campylobacterales bacterium]|nr:PAS domain S-box protein [Campylobacterales bacterium]
MSDSIAIDRNTQELKEIINNSWNGIGIIDQTSKFIYVNSAFTPILGFKEEELLQIKFEALLLPKYKAEFKELLRKNYENQYTNNMRVACLRRDKAVVYLDISIKLMLNKKYIVINANDITQQISDHETFDRYVIQAHVDTNGIFTKVSEAFCRLTLYSDQELLGKSYTLFSHPSLNEEDIEGTIWSDLIIHNQWTGVIASKNKHGDHIWVDMIIKPIKNKYGDITGYSAVMFDITSEVNLEQNKAQLEETIIDNEAKLKIMGETMRTVAHEWRQPLNAISLEAQSLLFSYQFTDEGVPKEEAVPVLEGIQENIQGLSNIINKFQYITELQGEKRVSHVKDICNRALNISTVSRDMVEENYKTNSEFKTHENELATSIASVLDNAKEAIERSGVENGYIKIETFERESNVVIAITNNGGNIDEKVLEKIFEPYFSTKETRNGVGLSLYIAKMIVELHLKGKIDVINEANGVVCFQFILPMDNK